MPFRQLPNTDATRITALDALLQKAGLVPEAERPYPAALHTQLTTLGAQFKLEAQQAGTALSAQSTATTQATLDFLALQMVVSHYLQVFNLGVARGTFPRAARAHYQLDISSAALPDLATQADVTLWAGRIVEGEAARLAATPGAPAMAMPSAAEVQTAAAAYAASSALQSEKKDTYDDEQEDVAALRPAADKLIKDIWDNIEFTYRNDPGPGKRRKCREWGLVYITRPGEEPDPVEPAPENPQSPIA
jgi:hypothetical protein